MTDRFQYYGRRIAQMKPAELLDRSRQALSKRYDAVASRLGYSFSSENRLTSFPARRFVFDSKSVDDILTLIQTLLPGQVKSIINDADRILQHNFTLLGYESLDYSSSSDTVDWHWDAVHRKKAPKTASHRIHYLDYEECGDAKIVWELNRHQHFVTLAKAYRLTGERRYLDEILQQKRHWESENPYSIGINWVSSLEVAFRSLSWLWTYHLLPESKHLDRSDWLRGLALHGRHIERYLSTYFSPNTHLLGEGVALFFLGVLCPELSTAARWKSRGWNIILQEAERQVCADGFHFERSTYYHVYATDFFLHALALAAANQIKVPKNFENAIEKMMNALFAMGRNGPPPQFGDDDGGRLFDPRRNRAIHFLDPLSAGAILFHRADFKAVTGKLTEESLWLFGRRGFESWEQLKPASAVAKPAALEQSGYYLLPREHDQLFFNTSPPGTCGHSHADSLSVCLQSRGQSLLIDCGTGEYVGAGRDRDLFRGTGMHNTLSVDDRDQAEPAGPFSWKRVGHSHVERLIQARSFDLVVASHDGYCELSQPARHRRYVISLDDGLYLIRDVIEGLGSHRLAIRWHLAPELEPLADHEFQVIGTSNRLAFLPAHGRHWTSTLEQARWSPCYGQECPTLALTFVSESLIPDECAVMLSLTEHRRQETFERITDPASSDIITYTYKSTDTEYSFIFNESGQSWTTGLLSTDAKYLHHKRGPGPSDEQLALCHGTYARSSTGLNLERKSQITWAELIASRAGRSIFSSDDSAIAEESNPYEATIESNLCGRS